MYVTRNLLRLHTFEFNFNSIANQIGGTQKHYLGYKLNNTVLVVWWQSIVNCSESFSLNVVNSLRTILEEF